MILWLSIPSISRQSKTPQQNIYSHIFAVLFFTFFAKISISFAEIGFRSEMTYDDGLNSYTQEAYQQKFQHLYAPHFSKCIFEQLTWMFEDSQITKQQNLI